MGGQEKAVITIGVFDGVHLGHQLLIKKTIELARQKEAKSLALTFDPLPEEFFRKEEGIVLTLPEEKKEILRRLGINYTLILNFNDAVASLSKEEFCNKLLLLNPVAIVVGEDFRFGKNAEGSVEDLKRAFSKKAEVYVEKLLTIDGVVVKSSFIRELLRRGKTLEAQKFLGRRYFVKGEVVLGKGIGKALLFPTANIEVNKRKLLPESGVYSGFVEVDGKKYAAGIFVSGAARSDKKIIEAHLLEFDGDLYGKELVVEFHEKVSEVMEFNRLEDLQRKIASDIEKVVQSILLK